MPKKLIAPFRLQYDDAPTKPKQPIVRLKPSYDTAAAAEAAKALQAGEFDKVFAAQAAFIDAAKKAAMAGALDHQPGLTPGEPVGREAQKQAEIAALRRHMGLPPQKKG